MSRSEVWLRGPVDGVHPALQPVAHALLQVAEDVPETVGSLTDDQLWMVIGRSATVGFHVAHVAGSIDRLFTYARNEPLSAAQREALADERTLLDRTPSSRELLDRLSTVVDAALAQLRATDPESLYHAREVGRAKLPSTVIGLLFHAAEHAARHGGQIATLARALQSPRDGRGGP